MKRVPNIKRAARAAYKNRYGLERVEIDASGRMLGYYLGHHSGPIKLGAIADCRTVKTDTGVRFYNRDFLVHTFGPNCEGM